MENQNLENTITQDLDKALRFYHKHLEQVKAYQKVNPEKVNEKNKKYYRKMKEEDPIKYAHYLEYHRIYNKKLRETKKAEQLTKALGI